MKNFNKSASVIAVGVLALSAAGAFAQTSSSGTANWASGGGGTWKNGNNEACWRSANWTSATATQGCDGAIVTPPPAPPVPVAPPPPPAVAPVPPPVAPAIVSEKVTFAADAFFDFDKAVLKPEGRAKLDEVVSKLNGVNLEVVVAVGHTDSVGGDAYNQALSLRRSEAVKAYLISKGVDKSRVYTEGKGESQPVADNKSTAGRAKNRRVEIEVVGTRNKQ